MKKILHNIAAICMAFVVLLSTMSFTIDMHYCGTTLVDTAIFKQAKSCGMEQQKTSNTNDCSFQKKNCCTDMQLDIAGQDELQLVFANYTPLEVQWLAVFVDSYLARFPLVETTQHSFYKHLPPLVVRPIYQLDESYLI